MSAERRPLPASLIGTAFRPARADDLPACAAIWREALNDYLEALNLEAIPDELGPIGRLHAHTLATDPDRFVVATVPAAGGVADRRLRRRRRARLAVVPVDAVRPPRGAGPGPRPGDPRADPAGARPDRDARHRRRQPPADLDRALLDATASSPGCRSSTCAARSSVRRPCRRCPSGIVSIPFETIAEGPTGGSGHRELAATVNALDRELLGVEHPDDHRFLRAEGRQGFLYRGPDGAPLGYGYAGAVGRIGPIAIRDGALLEAVVGHLAAAVPARGARAIWALGGGSAARPDAPGGRPPDRRTTRSCCAGIARSPISPATSRSRPGCSEPPSRAQRGSLLRRGSLVRAQGWSRDPVIGEPRRSGSPPRSRS